MTKEQLENYKQYQKRYRDSHKEYNKKYKKEHYIKNKLEINKKNSLWAKKMEASI